MVGPSWLTAHGACQGFHSGHVTVNQFECSVARDPRAMDKNCHPFYVVSDKVVHRA